MIPRRDRILIGSCMVLLCALAWGYLFHLGGEMSTVRASTTTMAGMGMTDSSWRPAEFALTFTMWAVMMVGMMGTTAAPVLLLFAASDSRGQERGVPAIVLLFGLGYLTIWFGFSACAALAQWSLHHAALLSSTMAVTSPRVAGALFAVAGVYQLTPVKNACLVHCQSPMGFLMSHWREGASGAFRMGLRHGVYCLGCCWAIMAVLFAVGVMNLIWVAALTVFILAERIGRGGVLVSRVGGAVMIGLGIYLVAMAPR